MLKGLGGLGGLGDMANLMKQLMSFKERMEAFKEELKHESAEGTAGAGLVTVRVNGNMDVTGVHIDPSLLNPAEPEVVETMLRAAANDAMEKMRGRARERMKELTGGMDLPGIS